MDCLLCNKVHFDGHPLDQNLTSSFCQLLDIQPTTFASIVNVNVNSSTSAICPACYIRLVEIQGLLQQLEIIQVKLDTLRKETIDDLVCRESLKIEERTKIIQEIRSKVYEKPSYEDNSSMSRVKMEKFEGDGDNSIQLFFEPNFFDNFDDPAADPDQSQDSAPSIMTTKNAQIILERIQLPPPSESINFDDVTKNSYNITQEPIASYIARDQVKFNFQKPSYKSPEIKRGRGRPKKTMGKSSRGGKTRGRPRKIFHTHDEKILIRRRKILKQISEGKTTKYSNNCNKKTKILCSICGLGFPRIAILLEHQRLHTGELPFKCEICGKGHRSKRLLISHQVSHGIGTSSVQCPICSIYMTKWTIQAHMDRHSGVKNHLCDFCAMEFTTFYTLEKHRASIHLNQNKLNCPSCDKVFNRKSNLKEHILKYHEKKFNVSCPECNKPFINNARMQVHRRSIHFKVKEKEEKSYPCNFCVKIFKKSANLNIHVKIHHTKDLPFKCTFEGCRSRGFVSNSRLGRHLLIHSGQMDHICPYCAKGYAVKSSLDTHIKHYCKNRP